jgi:hypothetical protein
VNEKTLVDTEVTRADPKLSLGLRNNVEKCSVYCTQFCCTDAAEGRRDPENHERQKKKKKIHRFFTSPRTWILFISGAMRTPLEWGQSQPTNQKAKYGRSPVHGSRHRPLKD